MPPDNKIQDSEEANRMWASASFVGVLIIIGLPLWWKTTEVYRVALPYDEINAFDPLSHRVYGHLVIHANDMQTAAELSAAVENGFKDDDVIKLHITKSVLSSSLQQTLTSAADEAEAMKLVASTMDLGDSNKFHLVQRTSLSKDAWLGNERLLFFKDVKTSDTVTQVLKSWVYQTNILHGARSDKADAARRIRYPPSGAYSILLSVVHPAPDKMAVDFDAKSSMEDYIGSFVDELSELHNFTLKSQWLHLLDFDFQATENSTPPRHFATKYSRLPQLLTKLEERSATRVSQEPTLSLVLYTVPCKMAPLVIYDHNDVKNPSSIQAFMSPKWGGVILSNPTAHECSQTPPRHSPDVRRVMGAFVAQLRKLLGFIDLDEIPKAHLEPLRSVAPRSWELDALMRIRTLEQITTAERTLQSLAKLLGEISNIVIDDAVGASISRAVRLLAGDVTAPAGDVTAPNGDVTAPAGHVAAAAARAHAAMLEADTAFNAPSLLALLYFPDDQKYAIYIPLFLPIMFPVILSLKNLIKWFRGKQVHKEKIE